MYSWQFSKKNFLSPKMAATFANNGKTQICFYLLNRARFCRNFRPTGYLNNVLLSIFKKNFLSPKMVAILNLGNSQKILLSPKMAAILNLGNFQKILFSPKMAAILNLQNFCQKRKL